MKRIIYIPFFSSLYDNSNFIGSLNLVDIDVLVPYTLDGIDVDVSYLSQVQSFMIHTDNVNVASSGAVESGVFDATSVATVTIQQVV